MAEAEFIHPVTTTSHIPDELWQGNWWRSWKNWDSGNFDLIKHDRGGRIILLGVHLNV
jgi:hypothetical protein